MAFVWLFLFLAACWVLGDLLVQWWYQGADSDGPEAGD